MSDCTSHRSARHAVCRRRLAAAERLRVDDHVRRCPPCHSRVDAERAVRDAACASGAANIASDAASPALRARCAALRGPARPPALRIWRCRRAELLQAPLRAARARRDAVILVGGAFVRISGHRELDARPGRRAHRRPREVLRRHERRCSARTSERGGRRAGDGRRFDWQHAPARSGGRRASSSSARVRASTAKARSRTSCTGITGKPVSLFMLPQRTARADETRRSDRPPGRVWSQDGRTFVLVAREPRAEVERMASLVQTALR